MLKKLKPLLVPLAILLLFYILLQSDLTEVIRIIQVMPSSLLLKLVGLQLLTQFLLNYQWYRLCKVLGWPTSFFKLMVANAYGMIGDALTPGEKVGGEVARIIQLNSYLGYSTGESTILVTIQKALSLSALVILNLLVVVTMADYVSLLQARIVRLMIILILVLFGVFLYLLLFRTYFLNNHVMKIKTSRKWLLSLIRWVNDFAHHADFIRQKRGELLLQFALSVLIWALFPFKLILLVLPYTSFVPVLVLFGTTFISYFAAMIPVLPGGLGTFEATMSSILVAYGLELYQALAVTMIFRFITFWFVLLLSLFIIGIDKIRRITLFRQMRCVYDDRQKA
jgi:uncharacterized protein (TIRG00374 family)